MAFCSPQFVERYCKGPWYDSVTTVLGVITGLLGSLYNVEIKSAFPFYWGPGELSAIAAVFWFVLLIFSFLFFLRHSATHIAQNKLYKQTETLERLMRTLPPDEFLTDFAKINNSCNDAARVIFSSAVVKREQIEQAIRVVLDGVVTLAKIFEGKPSDTDYAANIMLYRDVGSLNDDQKKLVSESIMFIENDVDVSALDAVLDLQILLSTTTETKKAEPDENLRPFFLPIPKNLKSSDNRRYKVLPGAPMAIVSGDMSIYSDTRKLAEWCKKEGDFSPSLCIDIEQYFQSERATKLRSFASIPLIDSSSNDRVGVLNIHRNNTGLLEEREPVKIFYPLMQPFIYLLKELIDKLSREAD